MADSAKDHFNEMRIRILEYGGKWRGFFLGMSKAYATAYEAQKQMLADLQKATKSVNAIEDNAKLFGLSLLTTLVGGPIANSFGFATNISPLRSEIQNEFDKTPAVVRKQASKVQDMIVGDWVNSLKGLAGLGPRSEEPFVPVGMTPAEYAAELLQGSEERTNLMADVARDWADRSQNFTAIQAAEMRENMMKSRFFADVPTSAMNSGTKDVLFRKAKLSLWVAWAWQRDKNYWRGVNIAEDHFGRGRTELSHWEPVRKDLIAAGVPEWVITRYSMIDMHKKTPLLDMAALIDWSFSAHAMAHLAAGLSADSLAVEQVRKQWMVNLMARQ